MSSGFLLPPWVGKRRRLLLEGDSSPGANDVYWDEVVLALDFENDFEDISNFGQTLQAQTANISRVTNTYKEGTTSAYCSGETLTDWLTYTDSTDFDMGTGDFTIEGWFRTDNITGTHILAGQWNGAHSTRAWCFYLQGATLQFIYSTGGASPITTITTAWTADTWYHIAAARQGTAIRLYLDGDYKAVANTASAINNAATADFTLFNDDTAGSTYSSQGYCDMFRWTVGSARYTGTTAGSFTPPTEF